MCRISISTLTTGYFYGNTTITKLQTIKLIKIMQRPMSTTYILYWLTIKTFTAIVKPTKTTKLNNIQSPAKVNATVLTEEINNLTIRRENLKRIKKKTKENKIKLNLMDVMSTTLSPSISALDRDFWLNCLFTFCEFGGVKGVKPFSV